MTTLKINCQLKIFEMILTILYNIPREIFLQAEELFYSKN